MKKKKTKVFGRALSLLLAFGLFIQGLLPVTIQAAEQNTIVFSIERFTIGQGYYMEPVLVEFTEGESLSDVIQRILGDKGIYTSNYNYLSGIIGADKGVDTVVIPEYITNMSGGDVTTESVKNYYNEMTEPEDVGILAEFTYHIQAGWFYHANGMDPRIGIDDYLLKNNDVIRLQYTLYGLGADLSGNGYNGEYAVAIENKDEITRLMAEVNSMTDAVRTYPAVQAAYAGAVSAVERVITPKAELDAAYNNLNAAVDEAVKHNEEQAGQKAAEVNKKIESLNETITLEDKAAVEEARKAYEELTEEQKKDVTSLDKLIKAEEAVKKLEEEKAAADQKAAEAVIEMIKGLKDPVTLADKEMIAGVRAAYDALSADQQKLVTNIENLVKAEEAITKIEEEKVAAEAVENLINALPEKAALENKAAVEQARAAYDALSPEQQKLVTNIEKLKKAEKEIADIEKGQPQTVEVLKDAAGKVELKGEGLTSDMELQVKLLGRDDEDVKLMQKQIPSTEGMIRIYDVKLLQDGKEIPLPEKAVLTLSVAKDFEGKTLKVLFCNEGKVDKLEGTVENGAMKLSVNELGSFGIVVNVKDVPKKQGSNPDGSQGANQGRNPGSGSGAGVIPGNKGSIKTGDEAPVGMLFMMGILSFAAIAVTYKKRNGIYGSAILTEGETDEKQK